MKADEVLTSIEREAPARGLPIIGPERGAFLEEVVRKHKPKRILEVGTLVGYSAIRMARSLGKGGRITCVEVNADIAKEARTNLEKAGLSDRVEILVGDAKKVIPRLKGTYDMVFIDASKEEYSTYLREAEKTLHPGSVVVADNVKAFAQQMADYLEYVRDSGRYKSEYHEAPSGADAIEVSVKQ
jgi:predicted O-methyltransferase YrrM